MMDEAHNIKQFTFLPTSVVYDYIDSYICEGLPTTMVYVGGCWKLYERDVIDYWLNRGLIRLIEKEES